jgi:hypothetical protein
MKGPIALRPEFRLLAVCYPLIHLDDLWLALVERTVQSIKGRKTPLAERMEKALEDTFLAVLANVSPEKWVYDDEVWQFIIERCRQSRVGNFWKRLTAKRRRQPLFDEVDLFLLQNWRVYKGGPGLWEWPRRDVIQLCKTKFPAEKLVISDDEMEWYRRRRKNLGLKLVSSKEKRRSS